MPRPWVQSHVCLECTVLISLRQISLRASSISFFTSELTFPWLSVYVDVMALGARCVLAGVLGAVVGRKERPWIVQHKCNCEQAVQLLIRVVSVNL